MSRLHRHLSWYCFPLYLKISGDVTISGLSEYTNCIRPLEGLLLQNIANPVLGAETDIGLQFILLTIFPLS